MKILLLNGPPRAGKDTISEMLKNANSSFVHQEKFAAPMKRVVPLVYSVPLDHWRTNLDTAANKDLPCAEFFDKTPREVQIALSEDYLKPLHGDTIFGKLLVRRLNMILGGLTDCAVISDSGFVQEAEQIVRKFGAQNVQLWKIYREGCDYEGDSRSYIDLTHLGIETYQVENNGSMDDLRDLVVPLYEALVLPREYEERKGKEDPELETKETWAKRRKAAAQTAFAEWPERRIARIEAEAKAG